MEAGSGIEIPWHQGFRTVCVAKVEGGSVAEKKQIPHSARNDNFEIGDDKLDL
jgi:hypothetical protein